MKIQFQIGDRVVIHTPDSKLTKKGPFPIRGRVHALTSLSDARNICIHRDDGLTGKGIDKSWVCIPDDAYMALEAVFDKSILVVAVDEDGYKTGTLVEKKTHVPGLDKEEINLDAFKSFRGML